jgi:hypothetical protein
MLGTAAVLQPAHQGGVPARHLQAIDAEVEAVLPVAFRVGPLGDDQRPGDERGGLARPAGLDGQAAEVDIVAGEHDLLAGRRAHGARLHGHHGAQHGQHVERLAPAAGRLGLAQEGQGLADLAQLGGFAVHAPGDPFDRAEQVDQHRHLRARAVGAHDVLEQHRRALFGEQAGLDLGHLQVRRDRCLDAHQPAALFQPGDEVPERGIWHAGVVL